MNMRISRTIRFLMKSLLKAERYKEVCVMRKESDGLRHEDIYRRITICNSETEAKDFVRHLKGATLIDVQELPTTDAPTRYAVVYRLNVKGR